MDDAPALPAPPTARQDDAEDVAWGLSTADAMWSRGEHADAIKWIRRAAESASEAGDDSRALELAKAAADLQTAVAENSAPKPPEAIAAAPPTTPGLGELPQREPAAPTVPAHRLTPSTPAPRPTSNQSASGADGKEANGRKGAAPQPLRTTATERPLAAAMRGVTMPRQPQEAPKIGEALPKSERPASDRPTREQLNRAPSSPPTAPPKSSAPDSSPPNLDAWEAPEPNGRGPEEGPLRVAAMAAPPDDLSKTVSIYVPTVAAAVKPPSVDPPPNSVEIQFRPSDSPPSWRPEDDMTVTMHGEDARVVSGGFTAEAKTDVNRDVLEHPPGPRVPDFVPPRLRQSQAVRVIVWKDSAGVHVAPQGTVVSAITVDAMLVALDESADLSAWLVHSQRKR